MKKTLFALLFLSVGLNLYFIQLDTTAVDNFEKEVIKSDQVTIAQSAIAPQCPSPSEKIIYKCPENEELESVESHNKQSTANDIASYDELQVEWLEKVNDFLELELKLAPEKIVAFHELKNQRNQELDRLLAMKIQKQVQELGEEVPYALTSEDTIELGKLNLKFEKKLLDLLGIEQMQEYQNFKQAFNRSKQDSSMMIDF